MVLRRFLFAAALALAPALAQPAPVALVAIEGVIGPATADFVGRSLERAAKEGAPLVVLRLDTPGGLDSSMRDIIRDILASPVPVAAWVGPSGARAASAGTFILYASHIAAMAPATNLGAASPVAIGAPSGGDQTDPSGKDGKKGAQPAGDTMMRKATNDAAAYIRSLAELRGRNADWAERAVREAVSLSSSEAKKIKVIDVVAEDVPALLKAIDGRTVKAGGETRKLATAGAEAVEIERDWRTEVLAVITNPSVAYLLILLGIYALIFEFTNPGLILPGVVGAICILVAMYAFQLLPVNYAGLALLLIGIAFMVAELWVTSSGVLAVGGLVAFVIGSIMLLDTDVPQFEIPYSLIAGVTLASAAFVFLVVGMLFRSRRRPVVSGREYLVGATGEALEDIEREGWARVRSERWRVRVDTPLRAGEALRITAVHGLILDATRAPADQ
ncbi:MAG: nodulation protein NfeD [Betaproteobacteria bacterium]|nr:nodulation protein NfeD [Betaproteobacteria bacterium]MDH5220250.1 nodulation protein NfeD [Betaproteobacteria bacterium]